MYIDYKIKSPKFITLIIIGLVCIFSSDLFAQNQKIEFYVDYAQFRLQQNYVYLEVYYSIARKSLTFKEANDGYHAIVTIKTYLKKGDSLMLIDSLIVQDWVKILEEILPSQKFAELSAIQIETGSYLLTSEFTDLNSNQKVYFSDSLKVIPFSDENLEISQVQFANSISVQKEREMKFDKNGLRVVPNASNTYGDGLYRLFFYAEAYNFIVSEESQGSTYHLEYHLLDQKGEIIQKVTGAPKKKPGSSSVINGCLDIGFLSSGFYKLKIVIGDDFSGQIAESEKRFFVYKPEDFMANKAQQQKMEQSEINEFENMDEATLDRHFEMAQYITSKEDKKIFKKLDVNGKRSFLYNFWQDLDPDRNTPINERKIQYYHLLEYANKNFSVGTRQGWRSDRARILLIYGQPDDVERHPSNPGTRDYQIWQYYELEGGVEFIFVDIRGIRDYELVHSTHRNEVHDYEWEERYLRY